MTMHKVAIYVRVSTTSQADEGYSIDEQKAKLTSYCDIKDWNIYEIYTDGGFSGSNTERPALEQLIRDAKRKLFDTVLVYKLDRLSRSQKDTLYLIEDVFLENDIEFVSLLENFDTSTPFGKAMIGLLSVFAQLEREQIKERMQLGKLGRAKSGKSMQWAKTSYGYDYIKETGTLSVNPYQALIVRKMFEWYLSGMSITKLRDTLNEQYGQDKEWNYRTVRVILSNPVYCGYNQFKGQIFPGTHEAIISEDDFNKTAKYMLSGIAQCGYCSAPLAIKLGMKRKDGTRLVKYECKQRHPRKTKGVTVYNNNEKCDSGFYFKEDIEHFVLTEISKLQTDSDYIDKLFSNTDKETIDRDSYQKQIDKLTAKISRLNDLYIDDRISLEELQKRSSDFMAERAALEKELEADSSIKDVERKQDIRRVLDTKDIFTLDYEQQKAIARALISKVRVTSETIVILWKL